MVVRSSVFITFVVREESDAALAHWRLVEVLVGDFFTVSEGEQELGQQFTQDNFREPVVLKETNKKT